MAATAPAASRGGRHAEGVVRAVERLGPAAPLVLGIAGVVVPLVVMPRAWGAALVGLLVGAATSGVLHLLTRRAAMADRVAAALATLAVVILVGWFQVTLLFNPWQAERDPPRVAWRRVSAHVPPGQPQYARVRYHNVLFYFARDLELLGPREYGRLPRGVPVTLFVTRAEFERLREHPAFRVRELADNPARAHKPTRTLVVAEVVRDGDGRDFVGDGEPHELRDEQPDAGARRGLIRDG
jgi:hypothetical protein